MKHLFISYELALKAKELGFNEPCLNVFRNGHLQKPTPYLLKNTQLIKEAISAPLYSQVIDWLRDSHKLFVLIDIGVDFDYYVPRLYKKGSTTDLVSAFEFFSYSKALDYAIEQAFKLISKQNADRLHTS